MFEETIKILSNEIQQQKYCNQDPSEMQKAIQILRDGKGYFTKETPKKVVWYKDI